MKTKEVKTAKTAAKKEVKNLVKSPLFFLHNLNKSAKKNTAIDGCKLESVAKLFNECNKITGKGFTFGVLPQNDSGQICRLKKFTPKSYRGGQIVEKYTGIFELLPVSLTFSGVLDAICSYIEYRADVEKDLQAVKKEKRLKKSDVFQMLKRGEIDETTFIKLFETAA